MASKLSDFTDSQDSESISEINVTPFVDVVLVLLVIFMITTPALVAKSIHVQLPTAKNTDSALPRTVGITVTAGGQFLLEGAVVSEDELVAKIREELQSFPELQAVIGADQESRHAALVRALDLVKGAGVQKFAIEVRKEK
jgi:biopolymer transport protein TolR